MEQQKNSNPIKHPEQRVGVFIDVQNLYYSAKNLYGKKVNYGNILKEAVAGRKLIRAIAYVVRTEGDEELSFFEALYNLGIETREKDLQIFQGGNKKADWDVGLTIDAVRLAPSLDTVVIVSGDGDYLPLVEYIQKGLGRQVEVVAFSNSASSKLMDAVDDFLDLTIDSDKYLISDKRGTMTPKYFRQKTTQTYKMTEPQNIKSSTPTPSGNITIARNENNTQIDAKKLAFPKNNSERVGDDKNKLTRKRRTPRRITNK